MSPSAPTTTVGQAFVKAHTADIPVLRIRPSAGWRALDLRELWRFRELLYFLVWRDVKVRYKQTVLGAAWALIQPLFLMVIFTVLFGKLGGISSEGVPYPLFSLSAVLPWTYFANALTGASNSLVGNSHLISKVYFPRLLIPAAAVLGGLVDFGLGLLLLLPLMLYFGCMPALATLLAVPLLTILTVGFALGTGLWLSALNVEYRDVRYAVPFVVQVWMFVTPVIWPLSRLDGTYRWLASLNPLAGVVEGFRSVVLGQAWDWTSLLLACVVTAATLITGAFYFRRLERTFADVV